MYKHRPYNHEELKHATRNGIPHWAVQKMVNKKLRFVPMFLWVKFLKYLFTYQR